MSDTKNRHEPGKKTQAKIWDKMARKDLEVPRVKVPK